MCSELSVNEERERGSTIRRTGSQMEGFYDLYDYVNLLQ